MKPARIALLGLLLMLMPFGSVTPASANVSVGVSFDVGLFYDNLAVHGRWVHSNYGYAWTPARVSSGWRPYYDGDWSYTDAGWYWDSDEPYGWIVYHYGRWVYDPVYGWLWIPGSEWAPSWVAWRWGGGYVGWCPLPPDGYAMRTGYGLPSRAFVDRLPAQNYVFVSQHDFLDRRVGRHAIPYSRNTMVWRSTADQTRFAVEGRRVVNRGLPVDQIERVTGQRVLRQRMIDSDRFAAPRRERDAVRVFRDPIRMSTNRRPPGAAVSQVEPRGNNRVTHTPPAQVGRHASPRSVEVRREVRPPSSRQVERRVVPVPHAPRTPAVQIGRDPQSKVTASPARPVEKGKPARTVKAHPKPGEKKPPKG